VIVTVSCSQLSSECDYAGSSYVQAILRLAIEKKMTILQIETPDNPILRKKARPVKVFDADLQLLIDDMIETMRDANGVGLAGPQINQSLRLAVVETLPEYDEEGEEIEGSRELLVLVNPEIAWESRNLEDGIEGCLSIPGWVGEVTRHESIRVRALDRNGKKIRLRLKEWTARIVQHEIDHLDGILYIDRLTDPDNFWREEEFAAEQEEGTEEDIPIG
jgi:peptide deformylase